jgi:hypothetical protein
MPIGSEHDGEIIKLLALTPQTASRLGRELKVDDGALTIHLHNTLARDGLIEVVGADGSSPVWALTAKGREHRKQLGYP